MSEQIINTMPKESLYWAKVKQEDKVFTLKNAMRRTKNEERKIKLWNEFVAIIGTIRMLENRMIYLGI